MKPEPKPEPKPKKTLTNVDMESLKGNVSDVELFGNAEKWLCIAKCWSEKENWMKSTKAMEIPGFGCLVQVLEQYQDKTTTSITAIPGVGVYPSKSGGYRLCGHRQCGEPEV